LRSRFALAREGFPHLVIIEGEPGIGKTRLANEALAEERVRGTGVLRGRCYEHLDLAYLPLRESLFAALARSIRGQPEREADAQLLAQVRGGDLETESAPEAFERAHTRQLLALTELVIECAATAPMVAFVDDIDWADKATTDFLRHLVFRLDDEQVPLLLLATSRADPNARAADAVAKLRVEPSTAALFVHSLTPLESAELARELHPGTPLDRARELAAASGGNPLLIEALGRAGDGAAGAALGVIGRKPGHPVTEALRSSLSAFGPRTRIVVLAAAVLGPECTRDLLAEVCQLDPLELVDPLDDAVNEGVLLDDGFTIGFSHPLYAHTGYTQAPIAERRALHGRAATTLFQRRQRGEPVSIRSVAHHVIAAGVGAKVDVPDECLRQAGDEALSLGAWGEAARCFEAALAARGSDLAVSEAIELHRLAGISRRSNLELPQAIGHFEAAIGLSGPETDPAVLAGLHVWRIRCAMGSRRMYDVATDRAALEVLVDEIEQDHPTLAVDALVQLSQSFWVEWRMKQAAAAAQRALDIAHRCGDHAACAWAVAAMTVPQWARYDLRESLVTLEQGVAQARLVAGSSPLASGGADSSALAGGALFRLPLVLTWLGHFDEAEARALECCEIAEQTQYPLELGLPLAALTQMAVVRGQFDQAEQHAHRALLIQRLTDYDWGAGLFLPALAGAHVARGQFEAARDALESWQTDDPMERATIDLLRRWITVHERGHAVQGEALPGLPQHPMIGADSWAAAAIEIARRESSPGDVRGAHDLLAAVDRRGGVFTSGLVTLVPRVLGVAMDLLGEEDQAVATLRRAIAVASDLAAAAELARAQMDLALILLRRKNRKDAAELLDLAATAFAQLGMIPDAERASSLAIAPAVESGRAPAVVTRARSVVFFSDIVDSTRLTEELGARPYRARARRVEHVVVSAIVTNGGSIVSGINLGDGFIGLFPTARQAIAAARVCSVEVPPSGLHLHMGIHQGEIIVDGPRIFGSAINYAARVCGKSGPDEVIVSESVRDAAAHESGVRFVDRGRHDLKGIAEPQNLYAVIDPDEALGNPD